ncbi:MAG: twin-arginine translocase subunit TatB [Acidobacteria bacterium]|nr:twin-arginine translocase subunit TatB [Acidobacteriota bacterium]MBV9477571.1 twin-arginine translocase subunit TatB [Acidobacteriota bacterium]
MFGSIGVPELLLIFVVVLIVFGPRRLPEIGRTLGKALGEFRKATDDLKNTIEREVRLEELKQIAPSVLTPVESISRSEPVKPAPAPETVKEPETLPVPASDPNEPRPTMAELARKAEIAAAEDAAVPAAVPSTAAGDHDAPIARGTLS